MLCIVTHDPIQSFVVTRGRIGYDCATLSTKPHGTGFGLPLALRTVDEHGGHMRLVVNGDSGGGAVFEVELPLAPPEPQS